MMLRWLLEAPGTPQGPELRLVQGRGAEGLEATRAAGAVRGPAGCQELPGATGASSDDCYIYIEKSCITYSTIYSIRYMIYV